MQSEDEPVLAEESVLRLIWRDYFKCDLDLPVQPAAFAPRKNESDGISVFRLACLNDPRDILQAIAADKQGLYTIASLPVADLIGLGLTVRPAKIAKVPGHAVLAELNSVACKTDKGRCKTLQKRLAEIASRMIIYRLEN